MRACVDCSQPLSSAGDSDVLPIPESDGLDGMNPSLTPLRDTKAERHEQKLQKTVKHNNQRKLDNAAQKAAKDIERERSCEEVKQAEDTKLDESIQKTLEFMKSQGLGFGNMLVRILDPTSGWKREHSEHFFNSPAQVRSVLDAWSAPQNSATLLKTIDDWVLKYMCRKAAQKANKATLSRTLLFQRKDVNEDFVTKKSLPELYRKLTVECPRISRILYAFCKAPRQGPESAESVAKKDKVTYSSEPNSRLAYIEISL